MNWTIKYILLICVSLASAALYAEPAFNIDNRFKVELLQKANKQANQYKYSTDIHNSGLLDNWFTPQEFIENSGGDCEDFAIYKYFELQKAGISIDDMFISYVHLYRSDKPEAHMVLIVNGLVLDIKEINNEILPISERTDLKVIYQFNENGLYVAGRNIGNAERIEHWRELLSRMDDEEMTD